MPTSSGNKSWLASFSPSHLLRYHGTLPPLRNLLFVNEPTADEGKYDRQTSREPGRVAIKGQRMAKNGKRTGDSSGHQREKNMSWYYRRCQIGFQEHWTISNQGVTPILFHTVSRTLLNQKLHHVRPPFGAKTISHQYRNMKQTKAQELWGERILDRLGEDRWSY